MQLVPFFTSTLALSIVGLIVLFAVKRFEMKTGRVFLGSFRPRVGAFFHSILVIFERALPSLAIYLVRRSILRSKRSIQEALARSIVSVERTLEGALHTLRYSTAPIQPTTRPASVFLREVADHKRKLLQNSTPARVVVEN